MKPYSLILCYRNNYKKFFLVLHAIVLGNIVLFGQCPETRVIAQSYLTASCGGHYFQSLIGADIPVYGHVGNIYLSSPLTDVVKVSSNDDIHSSKLVVFPNPANDILNVQWESDKNTTLELYSAFGQIISTITSASTSITTIDISNLPSGYYVIKSRTEDNYIFISKFIKQ
ncbi:MAG: T9SS type A sorting domain-containing protein [Saprospiraceae bacterium]